MRRKERSCQEPRLAVNDQVTEASPVGRQYGQAGRHRLGHDQSVILQAAVREVDEQVGPGHQLAKPFLREGAEKMHPLSDPCAGRELPDRASVLLAGGPVRGPAHHDHARRGNLLQEGPQEQNGEVLILAPDEGGRHQQQRSRVRDSVFKQEIAPDRAAIVGRVEEVRVYGEGHAEDPRPAREQPLGDPCADGGCHQDRVAGQESRRGVGPERSVRKRPMVDEDPRRRRGRLPGQRADLQIRLLRSGGEGKALPKYLCTDQVGAVPTAVIVQPRFEAYEDPRIGCRAQRVLLRRFRLLWTKSTP